MIEAKEICLRYPDDTIALNHIDLKINMGEIVYIIGPSGSGKTSLLKLILGMEYPTSGSLQVLGQNMVKARNEEIRNLRMKIGPVFQEFKLINGRTAMENVMMGMRFLDLPLDHLKEDAANALIKVGLSHRMLSLTENLSWGERQRVAIARAVARRPTLILADEPTGNLDKDNALHILELLTSFKDERTTVIITTHATHMIDREKEAKLVHMNNGNMSLERLGLT